MKRTRDKRKEAQMALANPDMKAAIAATRFGLGAKPGVTPGERHHSANFHGLGYAVEGDCKKR
jgi:uncharacterized protein (DUF1800 family)